MYLVEGGWRADKTWVAQRLGKRMGGLMVVSLFIDRNRLIASSEKQMANGCFLVY